MSWKLSAGVTTTERRVALVLSLLSLSAGLAACNAILGYDEGDGVTDPAGGAGGTHHTGAGGSGGTINTGGAGAVGGSGAQGASVGDENCLNGIDDNGDQLADCADPLCTGAGFACIETSAGRDPGFALSRQTASPAATCPAGFSQQTLYDDLSYDSLTCTCGCNEPGWPTCNWSGSLHTGAGCTGNSIPLQGGCMDATGYSSYQGSVSMQSPGSCTPTVSSGGVPDRSWLTAYDICLVDAAGAGCGANSVCTPPPPPGFPAAACTVVPDGGSCDGPYELLETLGSSDIVDERTCGTTGCNCGSAQGQSCVVSIGPMLNGDFCVGTWSPGPLGACDSTMGRPDLRVESPVGDGGFCPPSGSGTEQGEPHAAEEYSLCCVP